jgi:hypothetical protein
MDAKFCIKGMLLATCAQVENCGIEYAGGFPAEEPDPDGKLSIPVDFLVSNLACYHGFCASIELNIKDIFSSGIKRQSLCPTGDCFWDMHHACGSNCIFCLHSPFH